MKYEKIIKWILAVLFVVGIVFSFYGFLVGFESNGNAPVDNMLYCAYAFALITVAAVVFGVVVIGGINNPITHENLEESRKSLRLMEPKKMKDRLNEVSMPNWYHCIDEACRKAGLTRADIDYLDVLHMKRSGHYAMLKELGLREDQSIYLEDYGHVGQIDQILSLELALKQGKVKDGDVVCMIAAGIGYAWAANIIRWG